MFGVYFLVISGNNIFNARGIELSSSGLFILWLITITGIITGIVLLIQSLQKGENLGGSSNIETKKCHRYAEIIKLEAKVCKHCGYEFTTEKIEEANKMMKQLSSDELQELYNNSKCPHCKK